MASTIAFSGDTTAISTSSLSQPLAASPSASLIIPTPTAWSAGPPTASASYFAPTATASRAITQLYTVAAEGGLAEALPLPMACAGAYSADGKRMVYAATRWRPVRDRLHQLRLLETLSRRSRQLSLDCQLLRPRSPPKSRARTPTTSTPCGSATKSISSPTATAPSPCSVRSAQEQGTEVSASKTPAKISSSASAGPGGIVYEQFGGIHIYDLATKRSTQVSTSRSRPTSPRFGPTSRMCPAKSANAAHLAHRRARRLRSSRRNPHRARRKRRHAQPHQYSRRDGAHARLVARWKIHRLLLR